MKIFFIDVVSHLSDDLVQPANPMVYDFMAEGWNDRQFRRITQ